MEGWETVSVLASILPGLREIRTPLAVGYAWVLVGFLAFAHRLPDAAHATGPLADVYRAGRLATPVGITVAVSVAAYLVGVIVLPVTSAATKGVAKWRRVLPYRLSMRLGKAPDDRISEAFEAIAHDRLADRVRNDPDFRAALVRHGVEVGRLTGAEIDEARLDELLRKSSTVRRDAIIEARDDSLLVGELDELLPLMVQRMRGADDRAAAEYDRLVSESEFRAGMAWPLLALIAVVAIRASVWWLALLPAVPMLMASASASAVQATMLLSTIIASRRYEEPAVQVLESIPAQQLLSRKVQTAIWASPAARVVSALAISPDSAVIAGGTDDGYLMLWCAATGELRQAWSAHRDTISALVFTQNGIGLVSAGDDNKVSVWDSESGALIRTLDEPQRLSFLAFEPHSGLLVGAAFDALVYWDVNEAVRVKRRSLGNSFISSASMSRDGTVAVGLFDNSTVVLGGDGKPQATRADGALVAVCALDQERLISLEIDSESNYRLVSARSVAGVWTRSMLELPDEPYPPLTVVDGGPAAVLVLADAEDDIVVLSLADLSRRSCGKHRGVSTVAISPDRERLVSASRAGTVHVRDFVTGKLQSRLVPAVPAG